MYIIDNHCTRQSTIILWIYVCIFQQLNYLRSVKPVEAIRNSASEVVKHCDNELSRVDGIKHLFDAKRQNIDHQLEGIYRQRLVDIHRAVKQRLVSFLKIIFLNIRFYGTHEMNFTKFA